ncbi:MAG TPA: hypothetical protein VD846_06960 [Allosphingosinicella sp.]|nr:hypothetical protein [Allosphingosinicella sp.]
MRFAVALILLAALPGMAAAQEKVKVKKERATVALPIVVEAAAEPASRVYSFRRGEFWGWQPARYRSAMTLAEPVMLPDVGPGILMAAGERLIELQASSKNFSGSLYCTGRLPNPKLAGILLCLADRDGDGRMDQLWTASGSPKYLVPYPYARSRRPIAPVAVTPVEDKAGLALQLGFYVSGHNPIFGTHHFYPMLSTGGEVGYVFTQSKNSVPIKSLPKVFGVGGAQISLEAFEDKTYRARVTRPYPEGERPLVGEIPTQTIYVSVPG